MFAAERENSRTAASDFGTTEVAAQTYLADNDWQHTSLLSVGRRGKNFNASASWQRANDIRLDESLVEVDWSPTGRRERQEEVIKKKNWLINLKKGKINSNSSIRRVCKDAAEISYMGSELGSVKTRIKIGRRINNKCITECSAKDARIKIGRSISGMYIVLMCRKETD